MTRITTSLIAGALLLAIGGCGAEDVPARQTTAARADIHAADTVGAERTPEASLHLQLAQEELAMAERLFRNGDEERARRMLTRAELDAELAIALTQEADTRRQATDVRRRIQELDRAL
jgi:hypothetical protein